MTAEDGVRVGVVLGTRPEGVKLAPVIEELERTPGYRPVVVSTGQHRELLAQVLGAFGLRADVDLDLMGAGQSLTALAGHAVTALGEVIRRERIEVLVVQGDTTTTLAGALAGFYERVPVAHVEAGLRTDDRWSPYPEEVNRRMVTQLADLHLAPTPAARDRLLGEGLPSASVVLTGNTVVDALLKTLKVRRPYSGPQADQLESLDASGQRLVLVTAHRRESWDGGLTGIARAVRGIAEDHPDVAVVLPLHPNPTVRDAVAPMLRPLPQVLLTEPLEYPDFVRLLDRAHLVITDSGGVQEEACSLGRPTLVTRDTTERPEGEAAGGLRVVGTDPAPIRAEAARLLGDARAYQRLACSTFPFGDGRAAGRVVAALTSLVPPAPDCAGNDARAAGPLSPVRSATAVGP